MGIGRSARSNADLPSVDIGLDAEAGRSGARSAPTTRWIVVGCVAGLAALWGLTSVASNGASLTEAVQLPESGEPQLVVPTPLPTPTATAEPTPITDTSVETQASRVARTQLAMVGPRHALVYPAVGGSGFVNLSTGDVGVFDPGFASLSADVRVARQAQTLGFQGRDLGRLSRLATGALVATTAEDDKLAFTAGLGAFVYTMDTITQGLGVRHEVPPDATVSALDGYGILAFVEGEGTYVYGVDGPVLVTGAQILTGNDVARIERRCTEACALELVDVATGEAQPLPSSLAKRGSSYLISPDARFVLHIGEQGSGELYDVSSGALSWVTDRGITTAAWAPDVSFVAWIDTIEDPELHLMLPERNDWVVVKLNALGATPPREGEPVVVFNPG